MPNKLDISVEAVLLSLFPPGTRVIQSQPYRPDYRRYPMCVHLQTLGDGARRCVVKINLPGLIEREVKALRLLSRVGLAVPEVLFDPVPLPSEERTSEERTSEERTSEERTSEERTSEERTSEERTSEERTSEERTSEERTLVVLSELPGRSLPWCGITSLAEANLACRLTLEGVARLHHLTARVQDDAASLFPQNTLAAEYASTVADRGEWRNVGIFHEAVEAVGATLAEADTPLVFSNGDYNPLNFLCDGQALSGFIDFEGACFENPHIGFAKFLVWSRDEYGWGTGKKAGLVERYLYTRNISRRAFAPILVLRCLRHLIREISLTGSKDEAAREHILQLIAEGVQTIERE